MCLGPRSPWGPGWAVESAGDVNGDGFDDLLIGAPFANYDYDTFRNGTVYLVYGSASPSSISLADVESGQGGRTYRPTADNLRFGFALDGLGDLDGDGRDDFAIGASSNGWDYNNTLPFGRVYVVSGDSDAPAFAILGWDEEDSVGSQIAAAGDVNGDGLADVLVGAPSARQDDIWAVGRAFVVFGKQDAEDVQLSAVAQGQGGGFRVALDMPIESWYIGSVLAGLGDINGDGRDDIGVGVPRAPGGFDYYEPAPGQAYVIYGKDDADAVMLEDVAEGEGGFAFEGLSAGGDVGASMAGAGDVNGDRVPDLLISAPRHDHDAANNGAAYLMFGLGAPPDEASEEDAEDAE